MQFNHDAFDTHAADKLPPALDSETRALLRGFLTPILETAKDWPGLQSALVKRGYDIGFRAGRLVILDHETGTALCTGKCLGVPLRELSLRLGRPSVKADACGWYGTLIV